MLHARKASVLCGAGGMSLGFLAAGCRVAAAVDVDEVSGRTFFQNMKDLNPGSPPDVLSGDKGDLERVDIADVVGSVTPDIIIGGPPCQTYSRIGRAKLESLSGRGFEEDPRILLYDRFVNAVKRCQPLAFVMENVPGMLTVRGVNRAGGIATVLADEGYRVGYTLLNAAWFGVPQLRERVFFIGFREDLGIDPEAPQPTHRVNLPSGYIHRETQDNLRFEFDRSYKLRVSTDKAVKPVVTVKDAIDDLPEIKDHLEQSFVIRRRDFRKPREYPEGPRSDFAQEMRSWPGYPESLEVEDHVIRQTPRDYKTFSLMRPGDRYPEAIECAEKRFGEKLERLKRKGRPVVPGSKEYKDCRDSIVPPYPNDSYIDKWRKLIPDQPSWTVTAHLSKDSYSHIHYDDQQMRAISVREAARLQSFPDGFTFDGNMGDCFRQIGNAVPPLLAKAVAIQVCSQIHDCPRGQN